MMVPKFSPHQVAQVSSLVAEYITTQRERFFPGATPLNLAERAAMADYFLPQVLDASRVLVLHGSRVEDPPFYPMLAGMGFSDLPDFSQMAAITFGDVVVSHMPFSDGLLFHELVHRRRRHFCRSRVIQRPGAK